MKRILVTGGAGFIGSHTVVELLKNYKVIIADDLSNSSLSSLEGIERITGIKTEFEKIDLKCKGSVRELFAKYEIKDVIHFAAYKAVGESVEDPLKYYDNNISPIVYILQELTKKNKRTNFIFSSSCTVYGDSEKSPIREDELLPPAQSPYGNTKQIGEEILLDCCKAYNNLNVISLRYFNPIGGHPSNAIGELPIGKPRNLVPFITQTAIGIRDVLTVFGNDYETEDGTCIRDYIDVIDLSKAHIIALERLINQRNENKYETYNLGTGNGVSVKQVIASFEEVSGEKLKYEFGPRRSGDVTAAFADTTKANEHLGWKAGTTLKESLKNCWNWQKELSYNNK